MRAMDAVVLGFAAGFDNLRSTVGLAMLDLSAAARWRLGAGFVVVEFSAPAVGVGLAPFVAATIGELARLASIAVLLSIATISLFDRPSRLGGAFERIPAAFGLPLILGVDNVAAGVALGLSSHDPLPAAVIAGGLSAACAVLGLALGGRLRVVLPRSELAAALLLFGFGLLMLFAPEGIG